MKKIGKKSITSANILIAQIKKYDIYEAPYNFTFVEGIESPQIWRLGFGLLKKEEADFDADYISDDDNLDEIMQFDCENLEVKEMIDLNIFAGEQISETNYDNVVESENEPNYDINEVINAAMNNIK
ncbi:16160_t:CDS:2 [Dentiscutata heterogama]|uniref:16160_t:CDS:1 n=1 Tax=Dentiscutata heterogama TaxID=1316150 RepID=A0ACA9L7J9_9GLOM|nr:16160_t:CDS:2 [Dentiscutata heterogama]